MIYTRQELRLDDVEKLSRQLPVCKGSDSPDRRPRSPMSPTGLGFLRMRLKDGEFMSRLHVAEDAIPPLTSR